MHFLKVDSDQYNCVSVSDRLSASLLALHTKVLRTIPRRQQVYLKPTRQYLVPCVVDWIK